jgi:LPXTG-motif cell wall-anchored protein
MNKTQGFILVVLLGFFTLYALQSVQATELHQVETEGSIGFTGTYVPIGTPDPAPPESIEKPPVTELAKPEGSLPQTNTVTNHWLIYLGITLLSFVFFIWKRNKKEQTNEN